MEKNKKNLNDICKILFNDTCKNTYEKRVEENFLVLIADSVLQQGMNYTYFVLPRLEYIKMNFSNITHISNLTINDKDIEKILQVKNKRKIMMFKEIITLFLQEKLNTYADIENWLKYKENYKKLLNIHGFGNKTLDYMLNLFGYQTIPIDRHVYSFLKICDIQTNNYELASNIMNNIAEQNNFCKITFDKEIWHYIRDIKV